ncbi:hypothetical protein HYPSUDRAFT_60352, partial [Hypholoma sublateritium FD-334 SS-4]
TLQYQSDNAALLQLLPQQGRQNARQQRKKPSRGTKGGRRSVATKDTTQGQSNVGAGGGHGGGNAGGGHAVNWDPDCRRGGWFLRQGALESHEEALLEEEELEDIQVAWPIPENQVLFPDANHFLSCLAAACRSISQNSTSSSSITSSSVTSTSAVSLLERLVAENPWNTTGPYVDDSLASIALRCKASEDTFRVKVESLKRRKGTSARKILLDLLTVLQEEEKPEKVLRTLQYWMKDGAACCLLAGAGSIYLITIMACAQIKGHLKRLSADQVIRLAALIRCPTNDTPAGRLIISDIIPAVAKLRAQFNIKFTTMFAYTVLIDFKQPLTIMSDDIVASDGFFDSIAF